MTLDPMVYIYNYRHYKYKSPNPKTQNPQPLYIRMGQDESTDPEVPAAWADENGLEVGIAHEQGMSVVLFVLNPRTMLRTSGVIPGMRTDDGDVSFDLDLDLFFVGCRTMHMDGCSRPRAGLTIRNFSARLSYTCARRSPSKSPRKRPTLTISRGLLMPTLRLQNHLDTTGSTYKISPAGRPARRHAGARWPGRSMSRWHG